MFSSSAKRFKTRFRIYFPVRSGADQLKLHKHPGLTSKVFILVLSLLCASEKNLQAQSSFNQFLTPSDTFHGDRVLVLSIGGSGIYVGTLIGLNQLWYADYQHSSFHLFNDNTEWLQMDKAGHAYTAYLETVWSAEVLRWAGVRKNKAALIGAATGFVFQNTIEVLDGFSSQWGASPGDVIANSCGSLLGFTQYILWNEQRIRFKFSFHPVDYPDELSSRTDELFGAAFLHSAIKDYNGQTYWLSVNPSSFINKSDSKFPGWLSVAAGYGAAGLLGANENVWSENGEINERKDIERFREFYLSPDIDFTRIKTKSPVLKTCFSLLNAIKLPAPALQFNSSGKANFYLLYF